MDNYKEEMCENDIVHEDEVKNVLSKMPDDDDLCDLAELFKVFGDSTRTKIISALFIKQLCVCDIASILKMTKSAVSHQLRILRNTKLVKFEKRGKEVYYSLDDDHIYNIFKMGFDHIHEK